MAIRKASAGAIVALVAAGVFLTLVTAGLISSSQTVPSTGTVSAVNVGVYSDSQCTQNLTSISWGNIAPGGTATYTIYVKNSGTVQMTLNMTTNSWNPASANGPITLIWNKEATVLSAGSSTSATLTLTVSSSISSSITTFSFNIVITGTG
jgi:hypothetical protein